MAIPSTNYTEIITTTLNRYSSKIADNVTNHNPLLERLKRKGNADAVEGGVKILENLNYAENGTFKWYSGLETLDVSQSDVLTSAEFEWKECNANVVVSGKEKAQNSGTKESVHKLVKARVKAAERTFANQLSESCFYSNTENGGKSIGGFQHLVADLPSSGTVGGLDASSESWWRNQFYDFSDEAVTASASTIQHAMNTVFINTQRGRDKIDMFIADATYFMFYLESLQANQRFMSDETASAGFKSLKFWGGAADVFYDSSVPANHMYGLNTDFIHYRPHSNFNVVTLEEKASINQDATVVPMYWKGNMTVSNRNLQAVIVA